MKSNPASKKNKPVWLVPALLCISIAFVLFLPIRFAEVIVDKDSFSAKTIPLSSEEAIEQYVTASDDYFSALALWVRGGADVNRATPLILTITPRSQKLPVRIISTTFGHVFSSSAGNMRFPFWPIAHSRGAEYLVSLKIAVPSSMTIAVRQPAGVDSAQDRSVVMQSLSTKPLSAIILHQIFKLDTAGQDVYYYWHRGQEIIHGLNPYRCALDDTCLDHKNPGHFPLFYWLSAASQKLGVYEYPVWIAFWRPVFVAAWALIGAIIFAALYRRQQPLLALFSLFFWLFNRWSLYVLEVGQIDFLPILFLLLSLLLFEKRRIPSLILFSISLALKQVAIFLVPLYLVKIWKKNRQHPLRASLYSLLIIASVPVVSSAPLLALRLPAFIKGLLFSVTRTSQADLGAPALYRLLQLPGLPGVAFMLLLMALIYSMSWRRNMTLVAGSLAVFLTFLAFNGTIFNQYFAWLAVLAPLAVSELVAYPPKISYSSTRL